METLKDKRNNENNNNSFVINVSENLKKTYLYNEHVKLRKDYYVHSIEQENRNSKYMSKMTVMNQKTGEIKKLGFDFGKNIIKEYQVIQQKIGHIEYISKQQNLRPVFITFTLPSNYHPFISYNIGKGKREYKKLNPNFTFRNLENAIFSGYRYLNKYFRDFYKQIKRYEYGKEIKYIKVFEPHKTLIPHLHVLFFVNVKDLNKIKEYFNSFVEKKGLGRSEFETTIKTNIKNVSSYLKKYLSKNTKNTGEFSRILDGWKRKNKIRMITMSNVEINLSIYKKIYHSLREDIKKQYLKIAENEKKVLFTVLLERLEINETIFKNGKRQKTVKKRFLNSLKSDFIVKLEKYKDIKLFDEKIIFKIEAIEVYEKNNQRYREKNNFLEEIRLTKFNTFPAVFLGYKTKFSRDEEDKQITTQQIKNVVVRYKNEELYNQKDFLFLS